MRIALGLSYLGTPYQGWQSQPSGQTVQDRLEAALGQFATVPVATLCAGRTDAGVHALMQVVHFDTDLRREPFSWVRGTNRYLPPDIAVQWAQPPWPAATPTCCSNHPCAPAWTPGASAGAAGRWMAPPCGAPPTC